MSDRLPDPPSPGLLLRGYRPAAKKRMGQHFLSDPAILGRIVELAELRTGEPVLEIGPGPGALTTTLIASGAHVCAVELDRDAADYLRSHLVPHGLELVEADLMRLDLDELLGAWPRWSCVANLPYNVGTAMLFKLLDEGGASRFRRLVLMFQREVAQRLVAEPASASYGALSLMTQLRAACTMALSLPPGAFRPPPRVHSAVVVLDPIDGTRLPDEAVREQFVRLVKAAFQARRKTLVNGLKGAQLDKAWTQTWLEARGIDVRVRPERVDFETFAALAADSIALRASERP